MKVCSHRECFNWTLRGSDVCSAHMNIRLGIVLVSVAGLLVLAFLTMKEPCVEKPRERYISPSEFAPKQRDLPC